MKEQPDFYNLVEGKEKYSDPDFKPEDSSLMWSDLGETNNYIEKLQEHGSWKRAGTAFPNEALFGDSITPADVNQ